ncbi:MAG: AI-2E family transporter [Bacteroidota bacterium]
MRRAVWFILVIALTLVVLILLWQFRGAILLFGLSLVVAAALRPIIHAIGSSKRFSRRAALAITYLLLISSILVGILLISQPLARDLQNAANDFTAGYEHAKTDWPQHGTLFQKMLAERLPPPEDLYKALRGPQGVAALQGILGIARNFLSLLGSLAIVIVLSLYWSADQFRFERLGLSLLPTAQHAKALSTWRAVETEVGAFVRSETLQSVMTLILLGAGYWVLGVRVPVLLALLGALARLIPWFGVLIMILPALFIGLGGSPLTGLLYAAYTLAVLFFVRKVVQPRLFRAPQYNSLPLLLLLVVLAEGYGLAGLVLAPVFGMTLRILLQELNPTPPGRFSPQVMQRTVRLMDRLSELKRQARASASPDANPLMERIYQLGRSTRDLIRGY